MGNTTGGGRAICPFYVKEAKQSITCEGLIDGADNMARFASADEKRVFQRERCERFDYEKRCPLAAALAKKTAADETNDANSVQNDANSVRDAKHCKSIGERILEARQKQGYSQRDLAQKASISRSYLGDIELGRRNPSVEVLGFIATSLEKGVSYFLEDIQEDTYE